MKILQLVHSFKTGGAEILADRIGRHLSKEHKVMFACLDQFGEKGKELVADGYDVHLLERKDGFDRVCIKKLRELLVRERVDLVHAHQYTPFFYAAGARAFNAKPRIIFTEHGRFHPDKPSLKRGIFNRIMMRRDDRIIAVGNHVKHALIKNEHIAESKVKTIYNGIDLDAFRRSTSARKDQHLRNELNIREDTFIITQVARLDYLKDHLTAVQAIAELKNRQVILLIVGEGPERQSIEQEINKLGIRSHVRMLGLRTDIPALLDLSDAMILTSISEGIPLTLLEGMASSLPIVSTNVGGIPELIEHGTNGLLTPPQNPKAIAEAIQILIDKRSYALEVGRRGRIIAEERFSEDTMLRSYSRLCQEKIPH